MLCDEILADKKLAQLYPGFNSAQYGISRARKFVLASDFTAAADGLVNNKRELERIAPFCRLPFPICWFELAQADRPHFMDAPMHFAEHQMAPKRIGYLMMAVEPDKLWNWITVLAWRLHAAGPRHQVGEHWFMGGLETLNNASMITVEFNTKDGFPKLPYEGDDDLSRRIRLHVAPFCPPRMGETLLRHDNEIAKLMQSDWGGEIRYVFAMLGLFNARNVMEQHPADRTKLNRARVKSGKSPLASHTVLKIRAMHRRSFLGKPGQGSTADIRKHFVVGHWKTRRTGLFWWNPHWRGHGEGVVSHDYEVTT